MIRIRVQINCHTSLWYHILFLLRMDYSIVFCDHSLKFWRKSNFKVSRSEHQLSEELTCHIISGGQNHPQNAKYAFILAIYADIQISLPLCHSRSKFPNYLSINEEIFSLSLSLSLSVCLSFSLSLSLTHTHARTLEEDIITFICIISKFSHNNNNNKRSIFSKWLQGL